MHNSIGSDQIRSHNHSIIDEEGIVPHRDGDGVAIQRLVRSPISQLREIAEEMWNNMALQHIWERGRGEICCSCESGIGRCEDGDAAASVEGPGKIGFDKV